MTKPCTDCKHCKYKANIAGNYYCKSKRMITSIARITNTERADCFEIKRDKNKQLEVK